MGEYFVTITLLNRAPMTLMREAKSQGDLQRSLVKEFGEGVSFQCSERTEPRTVAEIDGRRIALESMDLPDGAYFAMAEELGVGFL